MLLNMIACNAALINAADAEDIVGFGGIIFSDHIRISYKIQLSTIQFEYR